MTTMQPGTIEYGLMVDWNDGGLPEFVPATSPQHADHLAATMYAHRKCWTVGREVQPWRYVSRGDHRLTDQVAR